MQMKNTIILGGTIISEPTYYTQLKTGISLFRTLMCVNRTSGNTDVLPLVFSKEMLPEFEIGAKMRITGRLQTKNRDKHLDVFARVYNIEPYIDDENYVEFEGIIGKNVYFRSTPSGKVITEATLANNIPRTSTSYVPTIFWGSVARFMSVANVGERYETVGRFQSRQYMKNGEERICYEYSANYAHEMRGEENEDNN